MHSPIQNVYFSRELSKKSSHYHDCHQIILITEGSVKISVNTACYTASAGDLILCSRYEDHALQVLTPAYSRYVLQIDPMATGQDSLFLLLSNRPKGFSHVIAMGSALDAARNCLEQLLLETQAPQPMGEQMASFLLGQLLVLIGRNLPQAQNLDSEDLAIVIQIQQLLETRYWEQWQLETLAKAYGISVSGLCHRFKAVTGSSVMAYLQDCRIASAKALLSSTALPVGQIVERCGFSDSSNFSRSFKVRTGFTPLQFRKQFRHSF